MQVKLAAAYTSKIALEFESGCCRQETLGLDPIELIVGPAFEPSEIPFPDLGLVAGCSTQCTPQPCFPLNSETECLECLEQAELAIAAVVQLELGFPDLLAQPRRGFPHLALLSTHAPKQVFDDLLILLDLLVEREEQRLAIRARRELPQTVQQLECCYGARKMIVEIGG
jgi:hypothetical protein